MSSTASVKKGVRAARESAKNSGGGTGRQTFRFSLKDGESARVRFLGLFREAMEDKAVKALSKEELADIAEIYGATRRVDKETKKKERLVDAVMRRMKQEEPVQTKEHWVPRANRGKGDGIQCTDHTKEGCVPCYQRAKSAAEKKAIGYAADKYHFLLWDYRKQHKVVGKNGDIYEWCTKEDRGSCKLCNKASENGPVHLAREQGRRKWSVGKQRMTEILGENDKLARRCLFCSGKVIVAGWACGSCGEEIEDIDADGVEVKCPHCDERSMPVEILEGKTCKKTCGAEPVRGSLSDCDITISRTGSDTKNTVYSFDAEEFSMPADHLVAWYPDWSKELKDPSTAEQAAQLGLDRNPLGGKESVGAKSYDDDDDEDDDHERGSSSRFDEDFGDDDIPF